MLYELIAGTTPFAGQPQTNKLDAVPLATRRELPPALDAVVLRALAREPGSRFADARMLGHALDAIALPPDEREPLTTTDASFSVFSTEATTASIVAPGANATTARRVGSAFRSHVR
jgi:serine/threonine-protein kinase